MIWVGVCGGWGGRGRVEAAAWQMSRWLSAEEEQATRSAAPMRSSPLCSTSPEHARQLRRGARAVAQLGGEGGSEGGGEEGATDCSGRGGSLAGLGGGGSQLVGAASSSQSVADSVPPCLPCRPKCPQDQVRAWLGRTSHWRHLVTCEQGVKRSLEVFSILWAPCVRGFSEDADNVLRGC